MPLVVGHQCSEYMLVIGDYSCTSRSELVKNVSVFIPLDKLVDFGANWHFVLIPVVSGS